jgi:NADPH:quinone reductase-like Zn-dependent oxidoreductase
MLIKVEAASLNRADLGLRRGSYRTRPEDLPLIPGREFAGTVASLGSQVSGFHKGQRVVAHTGLGGYAEYAVAKVSLVRAVPDGVDCVTAAAVPTVCLTAWFALMEDGKLKSGEQVLIQAGGSGVGTAAIQVAKHLGARVVTTAGTDEKCRRLKALGADETINYRTEDFREESLRLTKGRGVDLIFEMVGGEVYTKSLEVLAPGGRLVSIGGAAGPIPDPPPALTEGRRATRFSITNHLNAHPEGLNQLDTFLELIRRKRFQVVIDRTFPLSEARAAQRYLEGREHFGKIVLTM